MKNEENVKSVSKEQLIYAQKNMAFNALIFVWQCFLSTIRRFDGVKIAKSYMDSFKDTYDLISKPFVPTFSKEDK